MKCRASCQLCRCEICRVMQPWLFCCKWICFSSLWSHIIRKCAGFLFRKYKIVSKNSPMVTHYVRSAVFATSTCLMDQFLCRNVSKNKTLKTCRLGVKSNLLLFFFLYLQCFMSVSAGSALNIQGEEQQDRDSFVSFDQSCMLLPSCLLIRVVTLIMRSKLSVSSLNQGTKWHGHSLWMEENEATLIPRVHLLGGWG